MFDEYRKRIDRERRRFEAVRALVKHRRPDMTPVARGNVLTLGAIPRNFWGGRCGRCFPKVGRDTFF